MKAKEFDASNTGFPQADPSSMGGMMKGQAAMIMTNIYMIGLYQVIDHFFSGFIAAKLPFSLTRGFKGMFHFGIDLPTLEVTYVSSSSWYLLVFSGLREITSVVFGPESNLPMMGQDMMIPQTPNNTKNIFKEERENILLTQPSYSLEKSLQRVVSRLS
eukprot:TRINITY_DN876_c0_g1_i1.p1 TRINITY_DN876_c0_g1~~TRINITY_DN876_c0_g1_i1.p1  ORF type:complete len:159 (-),score=26.93 TRINITY_DN876_c0_g1_i1:43-519(-)